MELELRGNLEPAESVFYLNCLQSVWFPLQPGCASVTEIDIKKACKVDASPATKRKVLFAYCLLMMITTALIIVTSDDGDDDNDADDDDNDNDD